MAVDVKNLKAPFPYFGGKRSTADLVWRRLGDVDNYLEPFAGSAAMLLSRPHEPRMETINDADCYVANFWRATSREPWGVVEFADNPVNEADLHARHTWLTTGRAAEEFKERMKSDPEYYDIRFAGWWCWGACCWIGRGWCTPFGQRADGTRLESRPYLGDVGRGVNRNPAASTCAERREWLLEWFGALRDRLRTVCVCCGHWSRICDSEATTTLQGVCGVFLDPPYPTHAADGSYSRDANLYGTDTGRDALDELRDEVLAWCRKYGDNKKMRIAVCGYDTDGYADLVQEGWREVRWKAHGGYANIGNNHGKENAHRERIWFSPHCLGVDGDRQRDLFAEDDE